MNPESSSGSGSRGGPERHDAITAAAILFIVPSIGWLVAFAWELASLATTGDLPLVLGFRAGGGRIYDTFGRDAAVAGLALFAAVAALGILAGLLLWRSKRWGAVLGVLTIVVGPIFWYGFGLPIPPWIALLEIGLIVAGWKSLT